MNITNTKITYNGRPLNLLDVTTEGAWSMGWESFLTSKTWEQNPFGYDTHSLQYDNWNSGHSAAWEEFGKSGKGSKSTIDSCPLCGGDLPKNKKQCRDDMCSW